MDNVVVGILISLGALLWLIITFQWFNLGLGDRANFLRDWYSVWTTLIFAICWGALTIFIYPAITAKTPAPLQHCSIPAGATDLPTFG